MQATNLAPGFSFFVNGNEVYITKAGAKSITYTFGVSCAMSLPRAEFVKKFAQFFN